VVTTSPSVGAQASGTQQAAINKGNDFQAPTTDLARCIVPSFRARAGVRPVQCPKRGESITARENTLRA
jgi:hypothetical protein